MTALILHSIESALMSLSKQPALARIFASLAALSVTVCMAGCTNDDVQLDETIDASDVDPTEYIPASAEGPAQNVPEPNLPAVATENTEEGAKATLEYFWEAVDFARLTGETQNLELVSSDNCDFCHDFIEDWEATYKNGQWAVSSGEVRNEIKDVWTDFDGGYDAPSADVLFYVTDPAIDIYGSDGQLAQESSGSDDATEWYALMIFDGTAQHWRAEWIGVEELVDWEDK